MLFYHLNDKLFWNSYYLKGTKTPKISNKKAQPLPKPKKKPHKQTVWKKENSGEKKRKGSQKNNLPCLRLIRHRAPKLL